MIIQTQAIVLQIRPWSQTSHMVTWLTPEYGKIITSVKGACRPKSAFLGQYDLFYMCELLFYRREHDGVHAARECWAVNLREPLRQQWRNGIAAAYVADLTARVTVGHHEASRVYALLDSTLDLLANPLAPDPLTVLLWYETQLLAQLGLMPDMTTCDTCHVPAQSWLRVSLSSGRVICTHRAQQRADEALVSIHKDVRNLLQTFQNSVAFPLFMSPLRQRDTQNNVPRTNLLLGLFRFLGIFMSFHLDVPPVVRRVTWKMLNTTPAQETALLENS